LEDAASVDESIELDSSKTPNFIMTESKPSDSEGSSTEEEEKLNTL